MQWAPGCTRPKELWGTSLSVSTASKRQRTLFTKQWSSTRFAELHRLLSCIYDSVVLNLRFCLFTIKHCRMFWKSWKATSKYFRGSTKTEVLTASRFPPTSSKTWPRGEPSVKANHFFFLLSKVILNDRLTRLYYLFFFQDELCLCVLQPPFG